MSATPNNEIGSTTIGELVGDPNLTRIGPLTEPRATRGHVVSLICMSAIVLLIFYVLSSGPVLDTGFYRSGFLGEQTVVFGNGPGIFFIDAPAVVFIETLYTPLFWLQENTWLSTPLNWYRNLWVTPVDFATPYRTHGGVI